MIRAVFFKRAQALSTLMARYPMRSSWRAYPARRRNAAPRCPSVARMSPGGSARILGPRSRAACAPASASSIARGGTLRIVAQGCIATAGGPLADRLRIIHAQCRRADRAASRRRRSPSNACSSPRTPTARSSSARRAARRSPPCPAALGVHEYAPRAIKLAVVGVGGAEKTQVAHMVKQLLRDRAEARGRRGRCAGRRDLPRAHRRRRLSR